MSRPDEVNTKILVSRGVKRGESVETAEEIAAVLREWGHEVDIVCPDRVPSLEDYEAVVLGGSTYSGHWVENARRLAERIARSDSQPQTWLFSSGSVGVDPTPEAHLGDRPETHFPPGSGPEIDESTLSAGARAILVAVRVGEGDQRSWDEVSAWCRQIADSLVHAIDHPVSMAV